MKFLKAMGVLLKYLWFTLNALGYLTVWLAYINPQKGDVRASARRWKNRHVHAPVANFAWWMLIIAFG